MTLNSTVPADPEFSQDEISYIADHLADCVEYLEHLDVLWLGNVDDERKVDDQLEEAEIELPELPNELGTKLQSKITNSIQRGDLTAKALELGTKGIMEVLLAMIRPILTSRTTGNQE